MRILDRLVLRTFVRLFILSVLATPTLFILGDVAERLDTYLGRGLTLQEVAIGLMYRVPEFVAWSFPIAGLVAAVFTIHGMTTHREIVAAKAGGISFHRILFPILLMGVLIAGVGIYMAEWVPLSNRTAFEILGESDGQGSGEFRNDFAFRSEGGLDISVSQLIVSQNRISNVIVYQEFDSIQRHIEAGTGTFEDGTWWLAQGNMRTMLPGGGESAASFDALRLVGLTESPEELLIETRDADAMTRPEIERHARIISRSGGQANEYLVKLEQRLAIPAATLVIILFGAPLATSNRRGGAAYGVGISLASTLLYLLLMRVSGGLGTAGLIPPVWAAWAPNLLFLVAGLVLLARVRT